MYMLCAPITPSASEGKVSFMQIPAQLWTTDQYLLGQARGPAMSADQYLLESGGRKGKQGKMLQGWGNFILLLCPPEFLLGHGLPFFTMFAPCSLFRKPWRRCSIVLMKLDHDTWEGVKPQHVFWLNKGLPGFSEKFLKLSATGKVSFSWDLLLYVWITAYTVSLGCLCWMTDSKKKKKFPLNTWFLYSAWSSKLLFKDRRYIYNNKNNSVGSLTILSLPLLSHKWDKVCSFEMVP